MMTLAVDENGSDVYEGGGWLHAVYPPPILIPITFGLSGERIEPSQAIYASNMQYVFREDSFDPISRIKRGRVYRRDDTAPKDCLVYPHPARITESNHVAISGVFSKCLVVFWPYQGASNIQHI